jgi:hypothetical protein
MAEVDYTLGKKTDMFLRVHYEENPENESVSSVIIPHVTAVKRTGLRYHISWPLTSRISMQNRIEAVWVKKEESGMDRGIMIYQSIGYQPARLPLSLDMRIAWFNTGSYDSRIYAYEQDLSTGFSFSPLFNSGYRTYVMVRYDISHALSLRVRLSRIEYADMDSISSGADEIDGPGKTELKIQLSARF